MRIIDNEETPITNYLVRDEYYYGIVYKFVRPRSAINEEYRIKHLRPNKLEHEEGKTYYVNEVDSKENTYGKIKVKIYKY